LNRVDGFLCSRQTFITAQLAENWIKLSEDLDWVLGMGVNTTDVEVYGESYAGHVWVQVSQLGLFAVTGQSYQVVVDPAVILIMGIIIGVVSLSALVVVRKKRGRYKN